MNTNNKISIPRELLRQIDYNNIISGGVIHPIISAWREEDGYRMLVYAPGVDMEQVQIKAANQHFMMFYPMNVLGGTEQVPHYLVNVPLLPDIDVENISAKLREDGGILIAAPFNDWATGRSHQIDLERF